MYSLDLDLYEVETDIYQNQQEHALFEKASNNTLTAFRRGRVTPCEQADTSISPDTFAILFHVNLLDIFPQYWNDFPAEHWPYHGEDDPNYDRLTVSSGEMIGYADLRGTISDIALKKVGVKEYHYLSYFDEAVMTERVFETYREYGLANRDVHHLQ